MEHSLQSLASISNSLNEMQFRIDDTLPGQCVMYRRVYVDVMPQETTVSDRVKGVYEGGAKTWECTNDLISYLNETYLPSVLSSAHDNSRSRVESSKKILKVLELGCGTAVASCYISVKLQNILPFTIALQDYNSSVIEQIAFPNMIKNYAGDAGGRHPLDAPFSFYSGDWKDLVTVMPENEFDLIIGSELLYDVASYDCLLTLCTHCLSLQPEARIILATKSYYFGLDGGSFALKSFLNKNSAFQFDLQVLPWTKKGVSRDIIILSRRNAST